MTPTALFLAGTAVLSFASPAAAQSMDHSSMPGMTMPVEPKKPVAETVPVPQPQSEPAPMPEMEHGNMPGMEMNQADTRPPACAPEHAEMGHCTAEPTPSKPAMTMDVKIGRAHGWTQVTKAH